ncbi:MAG: hypothetical protein GF383_09665 [Candidatus Lokiarchaeota archaeon]|nr:hypothetical protein [Candidatus Lokiarchaeota archaeon]MBD3340791.1 hypothetical protein [Candidatus Lokiarchaeota archaeon]
MNPISVEIQDQLEKFVLQIIFQDKAFKSTKYLIEKVLEKAFEEKVTASERTIKSVIEQMNIDKKIEFSQSQGWKILI